MVLHSRIALRLFPPEKCDGLDLPFAGGIIGSSVTADNNDTTLVLCQRAEDSLQRASAYHGRRKRHERFLL